jgi:hypothetical protein
VHPGIFDPVDLLQLEFQLECEHKRLHNELPLLLKWAWSDQKDPDPTWSSSWSLALIWSHDIYISAMYCYLCKNLGSLSMWQVADHFNAIFNTCQLPSIYNKPPKSHYSCPLKMRYCRFVAVRGKNETLSISYSETGHLNMSCSQNWYLDLP